MTSLLSNPAYIDSPQALLGWAGWLALLAVNVLIFSRLLASQQRISRPGTNPARARFNIPLLVVLLVLAPLASLFFSINLPATQALPLPDRTVDIPGPLVVLFTALPWMLAAGLAGVVETAAVSLVSGVLLAAYGTHNPFTPLEILFLALLAHSAFKQPYRSFEFRLLRNPLFTALVLSIAYTFIFIYSSLFYASGSLAIRLDYAFTQVLYHTLAMAIQLLVAGLLSWLVALARPKAFGNQEPLRPSPMERRLTLRIIYSLSPFVLVLLVTVLVGNWIIAGNAAERLLESQMKSSAQLAGDTIPFFLENGLNLIQRIAGEEDWFTLTSEEQVTRLRQARLSTSFFESFYLLGPGNKTIAAYPVSDYSRSSPSPEEVVGLDLAFKGVPVQNYTVPPALGDRAAMVSFLAGVKDAQTGEIEAVLVGRASLASNPLTRPVLTNIDSLKNLDGSGLILDETGRVLYHSNPDLLIEPYQGIKSDEGGLFDDKAPDGTRQFVYYQPAAGYPWAIVLNVPASQAQQLALELAAQTLIVVLLIFIAAGILLVLALRLVTRSLTDLALQAGQLASGRLDQAVAVSGDDEVGQLRRAFEQMRTSLKSRMDELNRLLVVSQSVAASLNLNDSIKPVLESALSIGASSARIALSPAAMPDFESSSPRLTRFGLGPTSQLYSSLDDTLLDLARKQERLAISHVSRARAMNFPANVPRPEALLAIALRHEQIYYGVLWLAFERPHIFTEEETRFIATLTSQVAVGAANARLFQNAEIGRQRLESILASTPDPVLVTDQYDRLVLANPAAWHALGLNPDTTQGHPLSKVVSQPELASLLRQTGADRQSIEITAPDQRIYLATASTVIANGRSVGRVCILRDVTHFKELDALKSEFVSTVSHDLRSPLTLMRGYATMLEMVGQLNEQQGNYVKKIIHGVDTMARLVGNLLDLGRIEAGVDLQLELGEIPSLVERVCYALQPQAVQKSLQLSCNVPPQGLPLIEADHALLQQALHNLVENAIKYTDAGGNVTINVSLQGDQVLFLIKDTGIGIAPVDQPRLFEKFYRGGQRETRKRQGSGLGLAIVKSVIERHNGKIWVDSQLGKGSTFSFSIPLRQPRRQNKGEKSLLTE